MTGCLDPVPAPLSPSSVIALRRAMGERERKASCRWSRRAGYCIELLRLDEYELLFVDTYEVPRFDTVPLSHV